MKKVIFSIVGSMLIGLCAVQAQQPNDTTGTASKTRQQNNQKYEKSRQQSDRTPQQKDDQAWQQQSDRTQYPDGYANEGMVIIDKSEMPPAMKETLKQEKYAGWENATIYHNTNTGEYVIAPRAYRFNKQGKEMEMKNSAAYGNREGRQGRYSSGDLNSQDPARTRESQSRTQDQGYQDQSREQSAQQDQSAQSQSQTQTDRADNAQSSQPSDNRDQAQQSQSPQRDQQPSSSYRNDQSNESDANRQPQPGQSSQNQYNTENMTEIQAEQVPASLRRTLSESQYKGWEEKGTLYQDPGTSEYVLEMESTDNSSQPRTYRFDKNGQLKPGQNETNNNDQ